MRNNNMIKHSVIALFLLFLSITSGCQPAIEIPTFTPTPEATATAAIQPPTPTVTITPTDVPISSLPVDILVQKFMDGNVDDLSSLSVEQKMLFSQAYAEKLNQDVNAAVYNQRYYINPKTFNMSELNDGSSKQERTIQINLPAYKDDGGYLVIKNLDGKWVRIENSLEVDWSMIVDDPNDSRINWPTSSKGLSKPQWLAGLDESGREGAAIIKPIIILDPVIGEIALENDYGKLVQNIQILDVNQMDSTGNPLSARLSLLIIGGDFRIFEEGVDQMTSVSAGAEIEDYGKFWQAIKRNPNKVYYLIVSQDQPYNLSLTWNINANNWSGLILGDGSFKSFRDGLEVNDLLVLIGYSLIKKD